MTKILSELEQMKAMKQAKDKWNDDWTYNETLRDNRGAFIEGKYRCNHCGVVQPKSTKLDDSRLEVCVHCPKCNCVLWEVVAQPCGNTGLPADVWKYTKAFVESVTGEKCKKIKTARVAKERPGDIKSLGNPIKTHRTPAPFKDVAHLLTWKRSNPPKEFGPDCRYQSSMAWANSLLNDNFGVVNAELCARHSVTDEEWAHWQSLCNRPNQERFAPGSFPSFIPALLKIRSVKRTRQERVTAQLFAIA